MFKKKDYPILEFDESKDVYIDACNMIEEIDGIPQKCVITFFKDVLAKMKEENKLKFIWQMKYEGGKIDVFETEYLGERMVITNCPVGAPMAAGVIEELYALGCRKFIACGGCGVMVKNTEVGHLFIPTSGIRDEGTSYHYLPPSREVNASIEAVDAIKETLNKHKINYKLTKTWTTDAFYRETRNKVKDRVEEGCEVVEMEFTAFASVCQFKGAIFGQILYSGDDLSGETWDKRDWHYRDEIREFVVNLALESCLYLK